MRRTASLAVLGALLASVSAEAQVLRRVMSFPREFVRDAVIDDAGSVIYALTTTNQFGTNPDYRKQIVRWDPATGAGVPITDFEEGVESVSVSDDGAWLAFVTQADPLGTNHDESAELFVMHPDGTGLAQITSENLLPLAQRGIRAAVISGSGNRVAFVGRVNPLGTNPAYLSALFVVDRNGANLKQLKTSVRLAQETSGVLYWPSPGLDISDDGSKIVYFTDTSEIAGINADGTGDHTFSATAPPADVVLSGDGTKIAYATGGTLAHTVRVRTFDGNPATIVTLGSGECPSITDDATLVYLHLYAGAAGPAGIYRMSASGGTPTLVSAGLQLMRLSGSGNRIAARGTELVAIDNTGGSQKQLTTTTVSGHDATDFAITSDGHAMRFSSTYDPLGTNPGHQDEQFSLDLDGGAVTQTTDASLPTITVPAFSDPGDLFFVSASDLTGGNPCLTRQLFRRAPNGVLTQLTACGGTAVFQNDLEARPDGQVVAFFAGKLTTIQADGSGLTTLSAGTVALDYGVAGAGPTSWVAFCDVDNHVYRIRGDGTGLQQVTTQSSFSSKETISDDGNRVAWDARADYAGQNADGSFEAFVWDAPTGTIRQLTNTLGDLSTPRGARVTRDGHWVFVGDGRYDASTSAFEPAAFSHSAGQGFELLPDATGSRWLISVYDTLDNNPRSRRVFLADMNAVPVFTVGKTPPTVLSWDPSPTSLRYDVVRGSVANLAIAGSTVSLGPVSCLEDDSPDSHTRGYGDIADPAPGQAFFFVYRGSVGGNAATGSYGKGTGGKERVAGAGGCNP